MIPVLMLMLACGGSKDLRRYDMNMFLLASGYNAKMVCSCAFVQGHDDDHCQAMARVSPAVARFRIDRESKTVTSKSLGGWKRTARFVDAELGCTLDE